MISLTDKTFETEVSQGLSAVDFYTTTCGPCRVVAPLFKASEDKHPTIKHAKIDPTEGHDTFVKFNVNYVPTFILFKDGKELSRKGFMTEKELEEWLTENSK